MKYLLFIFMISCAQIQEDKEFRRFRLIDKNFPNVEMCILDEPEMKIYCRKVQSNETKTLPINAGDTFLMISQEDFLIVRKYLYKLFKEERNGRRY